MSKSVKRDVCLAWLRTCIAEGEAGIVDMHDYGDNRLLVIIRDVKFINKEASLKIADILTALIRRRYVRLVASCSGSFGRTPTEWTHKISDPNIRSQSVESLWESGRLSPEEYVHINLTRLRMPFDLFGVDDEELYRESLALWKECEPLWSFINEAPSEERVRDASTRPELAGLFDKMNKFIEMEQARAEAIFENTLKKMSELKVDVATIVCRGNIPSSLVAKAEARSISYVLIDIQRSIADNRALYSLFIHEDLTSASPSPKGRARLARLIHNLGVGRK